MEQRYNQLVKRLAETEQAFFNAQEEQETRMTHMRETLVGIHARMVEQAEQIAALTEKYNAAVARFNQAIETVNAMNERLTCLEANYDPTIIQS